MFWAKTLRASSRAPRLKKNLLEMNRIYKKRIKFEKRNVDSQEKISILNFFDLWRENKGFSKNVSKKYIRLIHENREKIYRGRIEIDRTQKEKNETGAPS